MRRSVRGGELPPRSHTHDPETSREAEARSAPRAATHREWVLGAVRAHPGLTGSEYADMAAGDPLFSGDPHRRLYEVRRRLSDLAHMRPPRIESYRVRGKREACWRPL